MEQDTLVDKGMTASSPLLKKKVKLKRADHELRKCIGNGKLRESVLKSYSCAWQKDILVHGRLHLTQSWMCFYSNILGWETKACVALKDITTISKQKTALVFPNAILVEVQDKKYGFTSFVHRDRSYKVLDLVWQNSQLQQPSNEDFLRAQLAQLSQARLHRQSTGGRSSFTGDSSDVESASIVSSTPPTHSPSHSQPSTPHTSLTHLPTSYASYSQPSTPQTASARLLQEAAQQDLSDSANAEDLMLEDQADGESGTLVQFQPLSSAYSSDAVSEKSSGDRSLTDSPVFQRHPTSEDESQSSSDSDTTYRNSQKPCTIHKLNRSPSLITLKPSMSDLDATPTQALLGGSPDYLHHCKQILSLNTLWRSLTTKAKHQHLALICTPSRVINLLIILFIILLLLSTVSMVCQLSRVDPALQPYLGWQPWCSCNHAASDAFTTA